MKNSRGEEDDRPGLAKAVAGAETSTSAEAALLRLTLGAADAEAWNADFALLQGKFLPKAGRD